MAGTRAIDDVVNGGCPAVRTTPFFVMPPGLFRVVLAYLVVIGHSTGIEIGSTAVYLFFVLSGYWVHRMWFKEYAMKKTPYGVFLISRLWRLLPVYYVCVALRLIVDSFLHTMIIRPGTGWSLIHFIIAQTTLLGYSQLQPHQFLLYPAWSLDIELQFYFIAPFIISMLARFELFAWPRVALVVFTLTGLALFVTVFANRPQTSYLPMYLIFFLIGTYCSRYNVAPGGRVVFASVSSVLVFLFFAVFLVWAGHSVFPAGLTAWLQEYNPVASVVSALLGIPYAVTTVNAAVTVKPRALLNDRVLSSLSYEIYLLHVTALAVLDRFNFHLHGRLPGAILTWILLFPASLLIYRLVDRPIDRMRTAWVKSRPLAIATS